MQQWDDLINTLVQNVTNANATEPLKEQTLETIGYICQDIVSKGMFYCVICKLQLCKNFVYKSFKVLLFKKNVEVTICSCT